MEDGEFEAFQHYKNEGLVHSHADQHELNRVGPSGVSDQPRARRRGGKDKLSEAQKKEKKRQIDVKYRLKKKIEVNKMTNQIKCLQEEIGRLSPENRHLKEETGRLTAENRHLKEETGRLTAENRHLKEETVRLTAENRRLEEHIRQMESKGKLPAEVVLQREDKYISQPMSQVDHQSVYVQNECLQEEIGRLSTENRQLKEETGRLTTQNRHLEEHIRQRQSKGKRPAEVALLGQDSYISQTTSQYKREIAQIITTINFTTQHYLTIEAQNSEMRAQLKELSQRLQSLNEIISFLNGVFDDEDTSLAFMEPAESNSFLNPWNLTYLNQPILASADIFQY